jgi:DNA-binding protein H-NS
MTTFNLDACSLAELKTLHKDVTRAIAEYSDRKKTEAMLAVEAHAKELGFSLAELTGGKKTRKPSGPGGAKYRHPENAELTCSGRGRRPGWFQAAMEAGKTPDSMAV